MNPRISAYWCQFGGFLPETDVMEGRYFVKVHTPINGACFGWIRASDFFIALLS